MLFSDEELGIIGIGLTVFTVSILIMIIVVTNTENARMCHDHDMIVHAEGCVAADGRIFVIKEKKVLEPINVKEE